MHKKVLMMLVVLLLAIGITGAQDDDPLAGVDPSGQTVTYWHEWDNLQLEAMNRIIADFNETNEFGITVVAQEYGTSSLLRDAISAGITSGELPNLAGAAFVNNAQGYFLDGILVTLDDYVDHPEYGIADDVNINQQVLDINRPALEPFGGQLLNWPVGISGNVLSTNLDHLDALREAGAIDFEGTVTNFDDFRAAACAYDQLTLPDGTALNGGFAMRIGSPELYDFINNFGGFVFDEENNRYDFTNEGAITAMQYLQDLYNDGCAYIPDGGTFENTGQFSLGLNIFAGGSSVGVPFIQGDIDENVEANGDDWDWNWVNATFPWTEDNRTAQTFLRGVAILESTPEQNLATWLFLRHWATNEDAQVVWTEFAQYQPYNTDTFANLSEQFLDENAPFTSFAEALDSDDIELWASPSHPQSFDISDVAGTLYSNITIGEMDVMEAAEMAEAEANEIYEEALEDLE